MAISSTSGVKIYVTTLANSTADTATAYAALSYTEIKLIESIGEYGDQASTVTFTSLGDARVRKQKGVRDAGDLNIVVANDPLDAGQLLMIANQKTAFSYAFKVILNDAADANDTDSIHYFRGLVASSRLNVGSANQIVKRNFVVLLDSQVIEVQSIAVP